MVTLTSLVGPSGRDTASPLLQDIPFYATLTPVAQNGSGDVQPVTKGRKRKSSEPVTPGTKGKVSTVHVKQEPAVGEYKVSLK